MNQEHRDYIIYSQRSKHLSILEYENLIYLSYAVLSLCLISSIHQPACSRRTRCGFDHLDCQGTCHAPLFAAPRRGDEGYKLTTFVMRLSSLFFRSNSFVAHPLPSSSFHPAFLRGHKVTAFAILLSSFFLSTWHLSCDALVCLTRFFGRPQFRGATNIPFRTPLSQAFLISSSVSRCIQVVAETRLCPA